MSILSGKDAVVAVGIVVVVDVGDGEGECMSETAYEYAINV
jgi:hypothetical protein